MEPSVLIQGGGLFLGAFSLHWVLWRLRGAPKAPALALSIYFIAIGAIYSAWRELDAATLILYASLAAAYIQTMPLAFLRSPTLELLLELDRAGERGLARDELGRDFDSESLFSRRIDELLTARLIAEDEAGRLHAKPRGRLCVPVFLVMRRVLGLPLGAG